MDALKNAFSGSAGNNTTETGTTQQSSGGGGFMGSLNSSLGGGQAGEQKEDYLDKGPHISLLFLSSSCK
jgi:hypothetical protein